MKEESNRGNGVDRTYCKFEKDISFEEGVLRNMEALNQYHERNDNWMRAYIDRTMPIKSHFLILLASLTILASFAAAIHFIDKL